MNRQQSNTLLAVESTALQAAEGWGMRTGEDERSIGSDRNDRAVMLLPECDLVPEGMAVAVLRGRADPASLLPAEAEQIRGCAEKRILDFAAGRACARRAMREFGHGATALPTGADRRPRWPAGLIGCISHTQGYCMAAAAQRSRFAAIGLDVEQLGEVEEEIWPQICTRRDSAWLAALPEPRRPAMASLLFSAKEALYKLQFEITGAWLGFEEAELAAISDHGSGGALTLRLLQPAAIRRLGGSLLGGRYRFESDRVMTAFALRPGEVSDVSGATALAT